VHQLLAAHPRQRDPDSPEVRANYQNGRLATLQAKADGYDAPIFLNQQGTGAGAVRQRCPDCAPRW